MERTKATTFKAAGVEVNGGSTNEGFEELGKDLVNLSRMAHWLTDKVLF